MDSQFITAIPSTWSESVLNDLLAKGTNITYGVVQPGPIEPNGVPFVRGGDIFNGQIDIENLRTISEKISNTYKRTLLHGGELLMSLVGYPGEVAIVPHSLKGANIARQVAYIKLDKSVSATYIMHYLRSNIGKHYLFQKSTGSAQQVINLIDLKEVNVITPPLPEQKKIATILTSVDTVIEKTQAQIDKLNDLKTGMMQELLTKGIGPDGKPHTEFKDSPVGRIPVGWGVSTIGSEFSLCSGSTPSRSNAANFSQSANAFPWVKTMDLNHDIIHVTDEKISRLAIQESACKLLPAGTTLVAMYGGWNQIGRTGILGMEGTTNQAICALVGNNKVLPEFANYWLISNRYRWKSIAASSRKDPNITKMDVEQFPIAVPQLDEQQLIVQKLNSFTQVVKSREDLHQRCKSLKKALMQDLLTGKVRVTPDPE